MNVFFNRTRRCLLFVGIVVLSSLSTRADTTAEMRMLMGRYCFECHGAKKQESDLDLEKAFASTLTQDHRLLESLLEVVSEGDMPPKEATVKPSDTERAALVTWLTTARTTLTMASQDDPGKVVIGRLTKAQYNYVIRDLTGHQLQAAKYFPDDVVAKSGFNNAGAQLSVSAAHIDSYLSAARFVVSHAQVTPERGIRWFAEPAPLADQPQALRMALLTEWLNWHVTEETRAFNERYEDPFDMQQAARELLRFADYFEAAWRVRHGADLAKTAAGAEPPLVVPVLRRWLEILRNEESTPLVGHLCEWWQKLPAPSDASLPAVRLEAQEWASRLLALQRPIWNKRWFETRETRFQENNAAGPGEVSEVTPNTSNQNNKFAKLQQSANYKQSATYGFLEEARFKLEIDLEKFGKRELVLVITDAWDGATGDEVRWHGMRFVMADGQEQRLSEVKLQAPSFHKLAVPEGAIRFHALVQLGDMDKAHASAQAIVLDREPVGDERHFYPQRYVLTWPEGSKRWQDAQGDLMHLFARSTKAAEGKNGREIYATAFLPADALPKLSDSQPEYPDGPYYLDQSELVEIASSSSLATRDALQRDLVTAAQLPLREFASGKNSELREGTIPESWPPEKRAAAEQFIEDNTAKARDQLAGFLRQAWRREILPEELEHFTSLFVREFTQGASYDAAMKNPLLVALMSPHFLYRSPALENEETSNPPNTSLGTSAGDRFVCLPPHELASRLSFFLWSSQPDAILLDAAESGSIDLAAQLDRMMKDKRVEALAEECFGRWLGFYGFADWNAPDAERFPEFTPTLRQAMHAETLAFISALLRENRPLTELVSSDRTFLNEELARHYGIPTVQGHELRDVKLDTPQRGGLLGMGSVLTKTSAPLRTSPVLRGVWLVERVLGRRVPPPPANVGQISNDEKDDHGLTVSEQLAQHRTNTNCAACHAKIDPPGIALEHFDPIGRWRETYRDNVPIMTAAEMDGATLAGFEGLRSFLVQHIDEVARTFCGRLLEFGLTRHEEAGDAALLQRMFTAMKADGWRVQPAFEQLVTSQQFTHRRAHSLTASSERK
jgi:hypothetical protein